jgi:hypothetical protein
VDDNRSLGQLIKEFRDETTLLFREEIALARTEISEKTTRMSRIVTSLATGGVIAFAGLVVLLIAAGEGVAAALIATGMEANALWLGPLIVGIIVVTIGGIMVMSAKERLKHESLVPEKTAKSLQENKEWVTQKAT